MTNFLFSPDVVVFSVAAGLFFALTLIEIGSMALGAAGSMFHIDVEYPAQRISPGVHP